MPTAGKLLSLLAVLGAAVTVYLNFGGFCFSEMRFRSGGEFIDAAIDLEIARTSYVKVTEQPGYVNLVSVPVVRHASRAEFKRHNPECCKIAPFNTGDGPYTSLLQRLRGHAAVQVSITYTLNYREGEGEIRNLVTTSKYVVTNCGIARTTSF